MNKITPLIIACCAFSSSLWAKEWSELYKISERVSKIDVQQHIGTARIQAQKNLVDDLKQKISIEKSRIQDLNQQTLNLHQNERDKGKMSDDAFLKVQLKSESQRRLIQRRLVRLERSLTEENNRLAHLTEEGGQSTYVMDSHSKPLREREVQYARQRFEKQVQHLAISQLENLHLTVDMRAEPLPESKVSNPPNDELLTSLELSSSPLPNPKTTTP